MRTFATKICSRPRAWGFTLIEVLVVVLVVSILMGVVVASFTGVDREQALRGHVERLALRIEMARDKALQANREWGMYIEEEGIRFAEFDEVNGEWVARAERPFAIESADFDLSYDVDVEEYAVAAGQDEGEDDDLPDIVLFSSGETTPFTIAITAEDWETAPWELSSDGFVRTEIGRSEL